MVKQVLFWFCVPTRTNDQAIWFETRRKAERWAEQHRTAHLQVVQAWCAQAARDAVKVTVSA